MQEGAFASSVEWPERRVVLLGASNLTHAFSTVVQIARERWGRQLDLMAALGLGRSYGLTNSIPGRVLPGILQCRLWADLAKRPPAPTAALVTDIGNDLFFGASVDQIAGWVERCLDELARQQARIVLARPPLCNLPRVRPWQYWLVRAAFFRRSRLSLAAVSELACELDQRLCQLARQYGCATVEPRAQWYGLDPIHIRFGHWREAWNEILASWSDAPAPARPRASPALWLYLCSRVPAERRVLGFAQRREQPSGRLRDGTLVSLY